MLQTLFVVYCFLLCLCKAIAQNECPIAYSCNNTQISEDNKVGVFCEESHKQNMTGRCCILNNTIIGLDLRFCEITKLNISQTHVSDIEILDLRDNDFEKFTSEDLIGFLALDYLYLSVHIPCPGGKAAWNITTMDNNLTSCLHQQNPCSYLNISCGEEDYAKCHHRGPGTAKCICCPGYYGYKCLNQGTFPTTIFSTGVIIPALVLSIMLWFVQGRDPYRKPAEEQL